MFNVCPGCGHFIPNDNAPGEYPGALSRWDNTTEICSDCGQQEALAQFWGRGIIGPGALTDILIEE